MSDTRDQIVDAMFALLEDRPYEEVTLRAIAEEAGLSLAEVAADFASRGAIIAAFVRRIDNEALAHDVSDMADEPPRERLFDVLMSRIEALRGHRGALAQLMRAVRSDPQLALGLNALAVRSQGLMLAAAGIAPSGWQGRIATQGLAISFARVLRTFVDEDEPGLPRTMAALDRELRAGEKRYLRVSRVIGEGVRDELRRGRKGSPQASAEPTSEFGAPQWQDAETLAPDTPAPTPDAPSFAGEPGSASAVSSRMGEDRIDPAPPIEEAPPVDPPPLPSETGPDPANAPSSDGTSQHGATAPDIVNADPDTPSAQNDDRDRVAGGPSSA